MTSAGSSNSVTELANAAMRCSQLEDYPQAATLYQQALRLAPNNPTLLFNYGALLRITGDLTAAEQTLDRAIAVNPDDYEAWHLRSGLRRQTQQANHVTELRAQLAASKAPKARVNLLYALAKELEDLAEYEQAINYLNEGAELRRRHLNYNVQDDVQTFAALARLTLPTPALNKAPAGTPTPIFVVSLPRAGSTLVERMLGCHNDVHLAGELNNFPQLLGQQLKQQSLAAGISFNSKPARSKAELVGLVEHFDQAAFSALGTGYLNSLPAPASGSRYVIDKLPLNLLNVGFIVNALPQAKIVYVRRNKLDHGYAMYKHLFAHAYPFSYNLAEISAYYDASHQLMDTWQRQFPEHVITLDYENLVAEPEHVSKQLFDFCGLNWSTEVLQFHKTNDAPSTTGSASQIRQPLHKRSIGLAQHYRSYLSALTN
ncbi:MAG: sulfotransferase [Idiomarina sp.]